MNRPAELTEELFVEPGIDLTMSDENHRPARMTAIELSKDELRGRWSTSSGKSILAQCRGSGYERATLDRLVGRLDGQSDLRGAPLSGAKMSKTDLSYIDFFSSDLQGAHLTRADLTHSYLSESNIKGANFDSANIAAEELVRTVF